MDTNGVRLASRETMNPPQPHSDFSMNKHLVTSGASVLEHGASFFLLSIQISSCSLEADFGSLSWSSSCKNMRNVLTSEM